MDETMRFDAPIYITSPLLPSLEKFNGTLERLWRSKWLTNHGDMHNQLEKALCGVLKVGHVSVFNNGTIALLTALTSLDLPYGSEVITTPFTFPATVHCIAWNGLKPVFCDIRPDTMTIDPDRIEDLVNEKTSAILGVHVYGYPCDIAKIQSIADRHGLKVVYDAAHAFTTEIDGRGIGGFGDISMFSFHATKLFNTLEGGCLTYNVPDYREKIYYLRNFGIKNEEEVVDLGINGKMNEMQAAIGLLNLEIFEEEKRKRRGIRSVYEDNLKDMDGVELPHKPDNVTDSLEYFVIRIKQGAFGLSRNDLYGKLRQYNVFPRKYFYPLCSDYAIYRHLPSAAEDRLPVANRIKNEVLCLPFYGDMGNQTAQTICDIIKSARGL
jgi:dTDP-4-amino-4,6-dideoxygalactose transaminase